MRRSCATEPMAGSMPMSAEALVRFLRALGVPEEQLVSLLQFGVVRLMRKMMEADARHPRVVVRELLAAPVVAVSSASSVVVRKMEPCWLSPRPLYIPAGWSIIDDSRDLFDGDRIDVGKIRLMSLEHLLDSEGSNEPMNNTFVSVPTQFLDAFLSLPTRIPQGWIGQRVLFGTPYLDTHGERVLRYLKYSVGQWSGWFCRKSDFASDQAAYVAAMYDVL